MNSNVPARSRSGSTHHLPLSAAQVSIATRVVLGPSKEETAVARTNTLEAKLWLSVDSPVEILLDESEEALFETLRSTAEAYNNGEIPLPAAWATTSTRVSIPTPHRNSNHPNNPHNQPLEFRVAGGWVRDKLLRLHTHDVDIGVNHLTGAQAAQMVKDYLEWIQQKSSSNKHIVKAGKIGVIAANPAQSKHLETATMKIGKIDVDFSNLRGKEVYGTDTRIPTTVFGSPLDDAMRRDFTLNALFFNLHTQQVEDWSQRGLADLIAGRLVTPLDPATTFRDDPLRVLRAIRFAVRYQFALDEAIEEAAKALAIHQALHVKVSRERVGNELEGMISGKQANPILALHTISRLHLAGSVFSLPVVGMGKVGSMKGVIAGREYNDMNHNSDEGRHIRELGWEESHELLEIFTKVLAVHENTLAELASIGAGTIHKQVSAYDQRLTAIGSFLLPFRELYYREIGKERYLLATSYIIREGIKFKNTDVAVITRVMETMDDMLDLVESVASSRPGTGQTMDDGTTLSSVSRLKAGLVLKATRESWVTSLLLATTLLIRKQTVGASQDPVDGPTVDFYEVCNHIYRSILDMGLDLSWKVKPLLDGRALIQKLSVPQGPQIKIYHDEQVRWMLLNPEGSRDECEMHLRSFKRKLEEGSEIDVVGMSDGSGLTPSSPVSASKKSIDLNHPHFSKKVHVESMELS